MNIEEQTGLWVTLDNVHIKKDEHCNMNIDLLDEDAVKEILTVNNSVYEFLSDNSFDIVFKVPINMAISRQLRFLADQVESLAYFKNKGDI